jgi:hypothetical protein
MGRLLPAALVLLAALGAPDASRAAWQSPGAGAQAAKAITLGSGNTPAASVSNRSVALSWSATSLPGGGPVGGYTVRRYSAAGVLQSIGSGCSGTIGSTSCTETGVPGGSWRYTVTPRQGNWSGVESSQSSAVTVAAPSLTVNSGSPLASVPGTVNVTLAAYASGQTLTYRLDNATTGTLLSATTTPSTIPAGGGATAAVTIPAGTTGGTHTIYAIGSAGDVTSATISVDSTVTTGAWKIGDLTGAGLLDVSAEPAYAGDSRTVETARWSSAFAATRYVELAYAGPLPAGKAVTGAAFDFRFAGERAGQTACFYFDVRRVSTGAVLATHGSSASPVGCVTGTALQSFSTPLPEVATSDLADDLAVRVYANQSGNRAITVDLATLSGTAGLTPFALHARTFVDAADATPATTTYALAAEDANAYLVDTAWPTAFSTARYMDVTFPAYVPATATVKSATLRHVQRPVNAAATACWYFEVRSGGAVIATHGSAAAPVSCVTGASFTPDSVPLAGVNTPARANDLTVRIYESVNGAANRRTEHDAVELSVRYGD